MMPPHSYRCAANPRCVWLAPSLTASLKVWSYPHYKYPDAFKLVPTQGSAPVTYAFYDAATKTTTHFDRERDVLAAAKEAQP